MLPARHNGTGQRLAPRPAGAFGSDVSIDMYPEYIAADVLAGLVDFSLGPVVTIDSRTALRADYTYRQLKVDDEMYPVPCLTAGFVIHH